MLLQIWVLQRGVTNGIKADPRGFTSVCGLGVWAYGTWHMWATVVTWHAYDDTRRTDVVNRGDSSIGVDQRGRQSSKG
jgi:hypothetical protein